MSQPLSRLARVALTSAALVTVLGTTAALGPVAPVGATESVEVGDVAARSAGHALRALWLGQQSTYGVVRRQLARLIAPRAGVDPEFLDAVWAQTDPRRMAAVLAALTQLGVPYRSRASTPGEGFDCSGLTSWAWSNSGVSLPHQSGRQIGGVAASSLEQVKAGDILHYPGHVMLALGLGGAMVHAPNSGNVVEVSTISERQLGRIRVGDPLPVPAGP